VFEEKLRSWAVKNFGSLTKLAEKLNMKLPNLHRYVSGARKPGMPFLMKLQGLGCDIDWLLSEDERPPQSIVQNAISSIINTEFEKKTHDYSPSTEKYLEDFINNNKEYLEKCAKEDAKTFAALMALLFENARLQDEIKRLKDLQEQR